MSDEMQNEMSSKTGFKPLMDDRPASTGETLAHLLPGQQGRVVALLPGCTGAERRRLLDLGLVPGTLIDVEMTSPLGDPTAYRVRGAQIALRQEQARMVQVASVTRNE
ncbi:MAG: ferrous iron transport protein A [Chloroflexaceae bacterium]|nr:ferrous iron transport protein A [Chloroflexaceae bacterium]